MSTSGQLQDPTDDQPITVEVDGALEAEHLQCFEALCRAARQGKASLSYAFDRVEARFRPVICVRYELNGQEMLLPVAPLVEDDPRLRFLPLGPKDPQPN